MYGIMCPVARPLGSSGKRKGTTMNNDEQNWEQTINWERFDPPAGGRAFFDFMKASIPKLEAGVAKLRAEFEAETLRVTGHLEIAKLAERLQKEFDAIAESESFQRMLVGLDGQIKAVFPSGDVPTVSCWLRWGARITTALHNGSLLPGGWTKDKAKAERELATAENLRKFVTLFVSVSERDYKLRLAPIRIRTKLFREIAREVNALVAAGEALERGQLTEQFVSDFWVKAKEILTIARKTQKVCRQVRKTLDRKGESFWRETADCGLMASA